LSELDFLPFISVHAARTQSIQMGMNGVVGMKNMPWAFIQNKNICCIQIL
jgi:hypothetical protein